MNFLVKRQNLYNPLDKYKWTYTVHAYSSDLKNQCYKDHFAQIRCAISCTWDTKSCAGCFLYYVDIALQTSIFLFFKAWYFNTLKCFYFVQMCSKTQGQMNYILAVNVLVDSQSSSPSQVHFSRWHWASAHLVTPCHQDLYLPSGHPVANVTAVVFKLFDWDWEALIWFPAISNDEGSLLS